MRLLALTTGFLIPLVAGSAWAQAPAHCAAPRELVEDEPRLPALAERFRDHQPVTIVVMGGASSAGTTPDSGYPHFLELALKGHHPDTPIAVINRSVAGNTAEQMVERFPKDIYPNQPALVVWETGTVDAVRGGDVDSFANTLTEGVEAIQSHKAELVLMDMQYNPGTVSVINFQPYLDALHQTAELQGVTLFMRFDMMKYWSEAGAFDFINVPREKRATLAREFYECLGERLADAIDFAARIGE